MDRGGSSEEEGFPEEETRGWLTKQGRRRKNWRRRYFVFSKGGQLTYYPNEKARKVLGSLDLSKRFFVSEWPVPGRPHCLAITVGSRRLIIQATSQPEMQHWKTILQTYRSTTGIEYRDLLPAPWSYLDSFLIEKICKYLDVRSLVALSHCCHGFWLVGTEIQSLWQHLYNKDFVEEPEAENKETDWRKRYIQRERSLTDAWAKRVASNPSKYFIVLLGSNLSGKSTILFQYLYHKFFPDDEPTIENLHTKKIEWEEETIELNILDTGGADEFAAMWEQAVLQGEGFMLCYSSTTQTSFQTVQEMYKMVTRVKECYKTPIVLVATKCDLEQQRQVSTEAGKKQAEAWGVPFFETSAKTGQNVEEAFAQLVQNVQNASHRRKIVKEKKKRVVK